MVRAWTWAVQVCAAALPTRTMPLPTQEACIFSRSRCGSRDGSSADPARPRAAPRRVISPGEMMPPGGRVDTVAELHEEHQVLRAQVELRIRTAEIEAAVLPDLPLGVLAQMATPLARAGLGSKAERRVRTSPGPYHSAPAV